MIDRVPQPRPLRPEPGFPPSSLAAGEWGSDGPYDLMTTAAVLGARAWTERRLHAIVGAWVTDVADPAVVTLLDRIAMRHAWRAGVLLARLPRLRELPEHDLVVDPGGPLGAELAHMAEIADRSGRTASWSSVASASLAGYRDHLARTTVIADAPLRRWLPLVIDSLDEDIAAVVVGDL